MVIFCDGSYYVWYSCHTTAFFFIKNLFFFYFFLFFPLHQHLSQLRQPTSTRNTWCLIIDWKDNESKQTINSKLRESEWLPANAGNGTCGIVVAAKKKCSAHWADGLWKPEIISRELKSQGTHYDFCTSTDVWFENKKKKTSDNY